MYLLVFRNFRLLQITAATIPTRAAAEVSTSITAITEPVIMANEPSLCVVIVGLGLGLGLVVALSLSPLPLMMLPLPLMSSVVTHTGRLNVPGPIVTAATCIQYSVDG